jgi:hypothetical protein
MRWITEVNFSLALIFSAARFGGPIWWYVAGLTVPSIIAFELVKLARDRRRAVMKKHDIQIRTSP